MEHLDELRRRIIHSAAYLLCGAIIAWIIREKLLYFLQAPLLKIGKSLVFTHPMDALNLNLQAALLGGAIIASPFILYQVWLFIAPGLYQRERRFVVPFMAATIGLFLGGASFGYFFVLPGAIKILILGELPILIFFLAMFGIVSPRFLWKNIRYAILAVFIVAAIICPSPDPWTMCIYAIPMLTLYVVGIGVAWWVHPERRRKKEAAAA